MQPAKAIRLAPQFGNAYLATLAGPTLVEAGPSKTDAVVSAADAGRSTSATAGCTPPLAGRMQAAVPVVSPQASQPSVSAGHCSRFLSSHVDFKKGSQHQ
jgi:hypothetical protein